MEAQAASSPFPATDEDTVERVLALAHTYLGMDAAWLSELRGDVQVVTHVQAGEGVRAPNTGYRAALADWYCGGVLDSRFPAVIPDVAADPEASRLPVTAAFGIGAYVGVPVRGADGTPRGMLCCVSGGARPHLADADLRILEMLAGILGGLAGHGARDAALETVRARTAGAIGGQGRTPRTAAHRRRAHRHRARRRGAEPVREPEGPDVWFSQAEPVGLRLDLEIAAARSALAALRRPGHAGYLSLNLSPEAVLSDAFPALMASVDPAAIVVEITEHAAVEDYEALSSVLRRYRDAGLRLAVDDAGAGYASLRHILKLRPDFIKIDLSLVRDIHVDPARQALVTSLVSFSRTVDASLVAEGVEQRGELDTLRPPRRAPDAGIPALPAVRGPAHDRVPRSVPRDAPAPAARARLTTSRRPGDLLPLLTMVHGERQLGPAARRFPAVAGQGPPPR